MAGQMRLSGYNIIPFDLHQPNAPLNPFIPSSCDKHLSFPRPLRLRDLTNFQGMLSIHRLGRQARKKRIEWSKRNKKRCIIERKTEQGEKEGKKTASNPLKYFLNPLSLAQSGKHHILPKQGFVIRVFSLCDSWLFTLAAN